MSNYNFNNSSVKLENVEQSVEVQKALFALGYTFPCGSTEVSDYAYYGFNISDSGKIFCAYTEEIYINNNINEVSALSIIEAAKVESRHIYADILVALSNNLPVQERSKAGWHTVSDKHMIRLLYRGIDPDCVRVKPSVIFVGGVEVPAPVDEPLTQGQVYYTPALIEPYNWYIWVGDDMDLLRLTRGVVHIQSTHAEIHSNAIAKLCLG